MNQKLTAPPSLETPTRVRYGVLGFACSLSMITYLDRVCFGSAASSIIRDLGLHGEADLKWAFFAFAFAYAAFEVPSGWLGDVFGPRNVLIRIVLWWSFFTALTGLVGLPLNGFTFGGIWLMVLVRLLFGMGEAGAYPNITRALHNWFPFQQRGFAQGAVWMSGRLMGGLTPIFWLLLVEGIQRIDLIDGEQVRTVLTMPLLTWRQTFYLFGVIGVGWCVLFALWFRNRPDQKPGVNKAELALIQEGRYDVGAGHGNVPWLKLLASGNLWCLCLMYFCAAYGWYFNITYLPRFLEQQGVDPKSLSGAVFKGGPLWLGAFACLGGGWLSDAFIRRTGNRKWGRRLFGVIGHGLTSLFCLALVFTADPFYSFLAISLAAFCNDLTMGSSWAVCQDIGRRYAAIVAGCMNTIGNLGGALAGWLTGEILHLTLAGVVPAQEAAARRVGYQINFVTFAVAYAIAVALWMRIDSTKPVVPEES